jgi:endonuclease-3
MPGKGEIARILKLLKQRHPAPRTALKYKTHFELLVATVLSAQSTDVQVNRITSGLFRKYTSIESFAHVPLEELQGDVSSVNFYKTKAKNIQGSARMIIEKYGSRVPASMPQLLTLPGVARKTANIILAGAFGLNEGIAVDTHVKRLSGRLGLTTHTDPLKIERDLMASTPKEEWANLSHLLIFHGREVCTARRPRHEECVLSDLCPSNDI